MRLNTVGIVAMLFLVFGDPARSERQSAQIATILKQYDSIRPQDRDLMVFKLDWEATLKSAVARARKERRPVLLIVVRNSNGDIRQGHC